MLWEEGGFVTSDWKKKFVVIYAGQVFSFLGSAAVQFAVIWWLTVQTGSAITLALATIVSCLPNMIIGPFAGVWVDKYNRRTVMIGADGLVALSSLILGAAFMISRTPPVGLVYIILFLRGLGNTFHAPAMQAAIPLFVPTDKLSKAGGWGNLITSISAMAGPVLGAVLMECLPVFAVMLVDILGAAFAIGCLLTVSIPDVPGSRQKLRLKDDLKRGFRAMKSNRPLMGALFPILFSTVLYMPLGSLFPLLVRLHYAGGAEHTAIVECVFSAGLLLSSLTMGLWGSSYRRFRMISASIFVMGLTAAISGVLPTEAFGGFVICCLIMGASGTFFNVPLMAYIQETVPPDVMGKVFSVLSAAMTLSTPFGLLIAGPVSETVGVAGWFWVSGILMAASGLVCFLATRRYDGSSGCGSDGRKKD